MNVEIQLDAQNVIQVTILTVHIVVLCVRMHFQAVEDALQVQFAWNANLAIFSILQINVMNVKFRCMAVLIAPIVQFVNHAHMDIIYQQVYSAYLVQRLMDVWLVSTIPIVNTVKQTIF